MSLKERAILFIIIIVLIAGMVISLTEENVRVNSNEDLKNTVDEKKDMYFSQVVDINTADRQLLETLDGIGEKKAIAIIEFRENNGSFQSIEDIVGVPGIGKVTLEKNRGRLKVDNVFNEESHTEKNADKLNVNTCTAEELVSLPGIGDVKAKAIIEYRDTNGSFSCFEDLLKVKGIGEKTLGSIKNFITF